MRKMLISLTVFSLTLIGCGVKNIPMDSNIPLTKTVSSLEKANYIVENFDKCIGIYYKGIVGDGKACYGVAKNVESVAFKSILLKTACKLGEKEACKDAENLLKLSASKCSNSIYDEYCRSYIYLSDQPIDTYNWEFLKINGVSDKVNKCFTEYRNEKIGSEDSIKNCKFALRHLINSIGIFDEVSKYETALDPSKVSMRYPNYTKKFKDLSYSLCEKTKDPEFCYLYNRINEEKFNRKYFKIYYDADAYLCSKYVYMPSCIAMTRTKYKPSTNLLGKPYFEVEYYKFDNKEANDLLQKLRKYVEEHQENIPLLLIDGYSYNLHSRSYKTKPFSSIISLEPKPLRESYFLWRVEYIYRNAHKEGIRELEQWCNTEINKCDMGAEEDALKCKLTNYCKSLLH